MKRIVASVGLVAVGVSSLQAALLPGMTTESGKPWTVSATLRGFYDDNINTLPNNAVIPAGYQRGSAGFEISPAIQFALPMEQTTLSFGYVYSFKYFENKPINNAENYDQTHDFNAALTHAFSERYQLSVRDSFVIGQEPDMLRAGNTYNSFQYISGFNLRNYGSVDLSAQLTPELGLGVGYANTYYSYADNQNTDANGNFAQGSYAGLLDELDNVAHLDLRYQFKPQTIGIIGYQFRDTEYIGNQQIGQYVDANGQTVKVMSDERNAIMNYGYVGVDQNFRPDLTGSVRLGGRYTTYPNNPTGQDEAAPYAMASLKYTYLPESFLQVGLNYDYSPSSVFSANSAGDLTLNAQALSVFAAITHRITPKLFGNIMGQYQNTVYYGGTYNNEAENYYTVSLNLQYRFNPYFSTEVGYLYDDVASDLPGRSFNRNRVYVGVTGSY